MTVRVKVCGITTYEDAAMALDCGADALGFNFHRASPRFIEPADARAIIRRLPPFVTSVGVFVNVEPPCDVQSIADLAGIGVLQLHGGETPEYCRELQRWPLIKALRIGGGLIEPDPREYVVAAFLLDSRHVQLFGGTGEAFDWAAVRKAGFERPIIVAGGLQPANVAAARRLLNPYGVDVCSGVEKKPGSKDPAKLRAFMEEVRNVCSKYSHGAR